MNFWLRTASGLRPEGASISQQAEDLQEVVLDDVPDRAGLVEEGAPVGDVELLGHRDLDAGHVLAPPDRLEERVGEPEVEQVLDRLLAQVVVDPEDRCLAEDPVDGRR